MLRVSFQFCCSNSPVHPFAPLKKATIFALGGNQSCFISNWDTKDANVAFNGKACKIPAWSVSILPDCNDEVYNTAKLNTQTSLMARRAANHVGEEPETLHWQWRSETFNHLRPKGRENVAGDYTANKLMDQKEVANDTSEYLWYINNLMVNEGDPLLGKSTSLQVDTSGYILHAFVNGRYIVVNVQLVKGQNQRALLSATVGFTNYGAFFDLIPAGVTGAVVLVSSINNTTVTRDLSTNKWVYKVGIPGELRKFYDVTSRCGRHGWREDLLVNRKFVWYKTCRPGLQGPRKGARVGEWQEHWPILDKHARQHRWLLSYMYHVPRSFLNDEGSNTLVLFEEFGGNPSFVTVQTLTVGRACTDAYEGSTLELSCQGGQRISKISTASFGNPTGKECGYQQGTCESLTALAAVTRACVGKPSCSMTVSEAFLGPSNCNDGQPRRLAVVAVC
ncbi:hypothetical protein Ancab_009053 [Ancistrocladus abbreviatus]